MFAELDFCLTQTVFYQRQADFEHIGNLTQFQFLVVMQDDDLALLCRQLAQRPLQKQMRGGAFLMIGVGQMASKLSVICWQRLLLLPLIAAEIGGDGVKIVFSFSLVAVFGELGEKADKGFLSQVLGLALVAAVEGAIFENIAVILEKR